MSLYRQPGRSTARTLLAAGIALVVGVAIGYALGAADGDGDEPSVRDAVAELRRELRSVGDALELVTTEYPQGVQGGRVVAQTEYEAAQADVARARDAVRARAADLRALTPDRTATLEQALAALAAAVDRRAAVPDVERLTGRARAALAALLPPAAAR